MVYQDPAACLNPALTIGAQVREPLTPPGADGRPGPGAGLGSSAGSGCPGRAGAGPLPAPALGGPAAASRHRHGHRLPPVAPHHGRADHRPRRHRRGPHPGPGPGAEDPASGAPSCTSPTTWGSWRRSATGWSSCTPARWWRRRRWASSSLAPAIRTPGPSWPPCPTSGGPSGCRRPSPAACRRGGRTTTGAPSPRAAGTPTTSAGRSPRSWSRRGWPIPSGASAGARWSARRRRRRSRAPITPGRPEGLWELDPPGSRPPAQGLPDGALAAGAPRRRLGGRRGRRDPGPGGRRDPGRRRRVRLGEDHPGPLRGGPGGPRRWPGAGWAEAHWPPRPAGAPPSAAGRCRWSSSTPPPR